MITHRVLCLTGASLFLHLGRASVPAARLLPRSLLRPCFCCLFGFTVTQFTLPCRDVAEGASARGLVGLNNPDHHYFTYFTLSTLDTSLFRFEGGSPEFSAATCQASLPSRFLRHVLEFPNNLIGLDRKEPVVHGIPESINNLPFAAPIHSNRYILIEHRGC